MISSITSAARIGIKLPSSTGIHLYLLMFLYSDNRFKQISINLNLKGTLHQIHQRFRNIQSKSRSFCMSRTISSDKSLHQFFFRDIQLILRSILDCCNDIFSIFNNINIHTTAIHLSSYSALACSMISLMDTTSICT